MAVKVGNSWVSEAAYAYAKQKTDASQRDTDALGQLSGKFPDMNFTSNTAPFQVSGTNNMSIAPNILRQMQTDPEKRLEYEAVIYDCNSLQKSLSGQISPSGKKLVAHGFILNSDGTLGSWSITSGSGIQAKSSFLLPKDDKKSWLTRILENAKLEPASAKKQKWLA